MRTAIINRMRTGLEKVLPGKRDDYKTACYDLLEMYDEECEETSEDSAYEQTITSLDDMMEDFTS